MSKHKSRKKYDVYIGTYTSLGGQGIYHGQLDQVTGNLVLSEKTTFAENPSFLAIHPTKPLLFCVNEVESYGQENSGSVSVFKIETQKDTLTLLNQQSSQGTHPCHISLDPKGKHVCVANYGSGSAAVLPILADGTLGQATGVMEYTGSSVVPGRQEEPHAHFIWTNNNYFTFVTDLGTDRIMIHRLNPENGTLKTHHNPWVEIAPGSGPRHLAFHPHLPIVYLINELTSIVSVFSYDQQGGHLIELENVPAYPANYLGENTGADLHVHPSGRFLYVSNRGHDSIAIFGINQETGSLKLLGHESTQGEAPRNFALDPRGELMIVANQSSNNLVVFRVDQKTGLLQPTGVKLSLPAPVCVKIV